MTPDTIHLIAQEIRNKRAELTAFEKWARSLDSQKSRVEVYHFVNFWRKLLAKAEQDIASGNATASVESGIGSGFSRSGSGL
jgi:hypothetical protein